MIIYDTKKFIEADFDSEKEIEDVVNENSEYFFGASSFFLTKKLIRTRDGFGTVPDGFAIDLASRTWFVVEVELIEHSVWNHIAPQIAKQLVAVSTNESRQLLEEIVILMFTESDEIKEKFKEEGIREIDVRKVVGQILKKSPVIGMPINRITQDLKEWAGTLKNEVKLWIVKKYAEFGNSVNVAYEIPEEFRPALDTVEETEKNKAGVTLYDVTLSNLIADGVVSVDEEFVMIYKPKGGTQKKYCAKITSDGEMVVLDRKFRSPSYAALFGIQDAGSSRKTVNGWTSWKNSNGLTLAELREKYLNKIAADFQQSMDK